MVKVADGSLYTVVWTSLSQSDSQVNVKFPEQFKYLIREVESKGKSSSKVVLCWCSGSCQEKYVEN